MVWGPCRNRETLKYFSDKRCLHILPPLSFLSLCHFPLHVFVLSACVCVYVCICVCYSAFVNEIISCAANAKANADAKASLSITHFPLTVARDTDTGTWAGVGAGAVARKDNAYRKDAAPGAKANPKSSGPRIERCLWRCPLTSMRYAM